MPTDSPIQAAADLAGKKVAVTKGSSANALLVRALQAGGLKWGDAEAVFLQPADAKAAFEGGSVDAWSIWDPYYALEEHDTGARTLLTDESVGAANRSFYLASRSFATDHADALQALGDALTETEAWAGSHSEEVAKLIAGETGTRRAGLAQRREAAGLRHRADHAGDHRRAAVAGRSLPRRGVDPTTTRYLQARRCHRA